MEKQPGNHTKKLNPERNKELKDEILRNMRSLAAQIGNPSKEQVTEFLNTIKNSSFICLIQKETRNTSKSQRRRKQPSSNSDRLILAEDAIMELGLNEYRENNDLIKFALFYDLAIGIRKAQESFNTVQLLEEKPDLDFLPSIKSIVIEGARLGHLLLKP